MPSNDSNHWNVLALLKESAPEFVSGNALAVRLNLTRTGIWKNIRTLITLGYHIDSHPRRGYRLVGVPDLLIPEVILPSLTTSWLGRAYYHHSQITSTNDCALQWAAKGAPHGTVIVAEQQTQGRGRMRRPWLSQAGSGIYVSMLLTRPIPVRDAPLMTMVAALALTTILRENFGLAAAVKWPNDILIGSRKLAGILTEMQSDQDRAIFIIIGIGINVNHTQDQLEGPFRYPATSLAVELGTPVRRQDVLLSLLHRLEWEYDRFMTEGFGALLRDVEEASAILHKVVTVHCGNREISGRALGFTPEGGLKLLTLDNKEEIIWVGDVTQVEGFD